MDLELASGQRSSTSLSKAKEKLPKFFLSKLKILPVHQARGQLLSYLMQQLSSGNSVVAYIISVYFVEDNVPL